MVAVNQQAAIAAANAAQQAAAQAVAANKQNAPRANYKYAPGVRNPAQVMAMGGPQPVPQQQPQPAVLIQGQERLLACYWRLTTLNWFICWKTDSLSKERWMRP